jgi:hypothetical protein
LLLSVSTQPASSRSAAVVVVNTGVAPAPSKQLADPNPAQSSTVAVGQVP